MHVHGLVKRNEVHYVIGYGQENSLRGDSHDVPDLVPGSCRRGKVLDGLEGEGLGNGLEPCLDLKEKGVNDMYQKSEEKEGLRKGVSMIGYTPRASYFKHNASVNLVERHTTHSRSGPRQHKP